LVLYSPLSLSARELHPLLLQRIPITLCPSIHLELSETIKDHIHVNWVLKRVVEDQAAQHRAFSLHISCDLSYQYLMSGSLELDVTSVVPQVLRWSDLTREEKT
jgi:hypothetical protein